MTGQTTSLPSLPTIATEWGNVFAFVRKPVLPHQPMLNFRRGAVAISRVLVLDLMAMSALFAIAGVVMLTGVELPQTALAGMEITPAIIVTVVLVAPVLEEIIFRSWLSGRPRYLIAIPIFVIAGVIAALMAANATGETAQARVGFVIIGAILLALISAAVLWKRPPMKWFQSLFPVMFWLSALAFAAIHFANFSEGSWVSLIPLVLPQFILGILLGYMRVNYGLWTAIALHMIHNGLIIALVTAASKAAVGG